MNQHLLGPCRDPESITEKALKEAVIADEPIWRPNELALLTPLEIMAGLVAAAETESAAWVEALLDFENQRHPPALVQVTALALAQLSWKDVSENMWARMRKRVSEEVVYKSVEWLCSWEGRGSLRGLERLVSWLPPGFLVSRSSEVLRLAAGAASEDAVGFLIPLCDVGRWGPDALERAAAQQRAPNVDRLVQHVPQGVVDDLAAKFFGKKEAGSFSLLIPHLSRSLLGGYLQKSARRKTGDWIRVHAELSAQILEQSAMPFPSAVRSRYRL